MAMMKRILAVLMALALVFACGYAETAEGDGTTNEEIFLGDPVVARRMSGAEGEEIGLVDDESQDWYDALYEATASYEVPAGVVEGDALRVPGMALAMDETSRSILLATENAQLGDNDVVDSSGKITIMLLGIDARPGQKSGRSDCMILVTVDIESNTIKLMSFMRDMYVTIPGYDSNRLNTAYFRGGAPLLKKTLEKNFGVSFDYYVAVDFSALGSIVDQLGGLEINVETEYFVDRINAVIKQDNKVLGINEKDGLIKKAGLQLLTGKQVQAYARFRYGAQSGGDWARTARQREVITKIFEKLTDMSVVQMANLALANMSYVATDMTIADIVQLAPMVLQLKEAGISELRVPADGMYSNQTVSGMAVIVPNMKKVLPSIKEFLEQ